MATAEEEHKVALKLLVDKEQNKVIFAEADNHFADVLFSFLTLPLGTIVRLVGGGEQSDTEPGLKVGSLANLYKSVEDLDLKFFSTEICKDMLLHPRNDAELECQGLKVNIDDTEAPKYFRCEDCSYNYVTTCRFAPCKCGELMYASASYKRMTMDSSYQEELFFYNSTTLIIGDDLSIMPSSPTIIVELFTRFGITDLKLLTERVVHLGKKEVLDLLKWSLISTTPLTDAFLRTGHRIQVPSEPCAIIPPKIVAHNTNNSSQQFSLKLLVRKSDNKVLFAQGNEDFINQILSLLTVPLGLAVQLLGGNSSLGSVDQLYTSIMNRDLGTYLISRDPPENNKLLNPKLAGHFNCEEQLLPLRVAQPKSVNVEVNGNYKTFYELNPKLLCARYGSTEDGGAFVKSPATFIVTDDLVVKPISSLLSVAYLERLNIPKNDIEEKVIAFGIEQAYKLLKCSLLSESALTQALMVDLLKTPKKEK